MERKNIGAISTALFFSAFALYEAIRLRWVADDAFISFRYVLSFVNGNGLTFNSGEKVEGFTNFLWTVLLIPFSAAGLDLEQASVVLGLAAFAVLLAVFLYFSRGWRTEARAAAFLFFCAHRHLQIFATSGLETMLFTLFVTSGVLCISALRTMRSRSLGFFVLALAVLTRPDGAIVYAVCAALDLGGHLKVRESRSAAAVMRSFVSVHAAAMAILLPVWAAKSLYYGSIVPNTFYAKSASDPYLSQGIRYAALYFSAYWPLGLVLVASAVMSIRSAGLRMPLAVCGAYIAWVIYVGGDFMFARFLIPITPLLIYCAGILISEISGRTWRYAASFLLLSGLILKPDPFAGSIAVHGISEENRIYTRSGRQEMRRTAEGLREALLAANPRIAFVGAQAAFAYYWYPLFAIESETGLTDRVIASRRVTERGHVGHEKQADPAYLISRGVDVWLRPPPPGFEPEAILTIEGIPGDLCILRKNPELFARLSRDPRFHVRPAR